MGLQLWLPLNGSLNNQGLSNATITNNGATVNTSGKIGKCYQFGTAAQSLIISKETMTNFQTECSVCFWLKILTWNTSYATFFQAGLGGAPWAHYIFGFLRNNANSTCCFTISNGSTSSTTNYLTPVLELDKWYHIGLIYKTGHCLIYINGELYQDYSTTIVPKFSSIATITLGACNNKTGYATNCQMNDFRIYDQCLSAKEIKKISRGLVLHYPMSGPGVENFIKGNYSCITTNSSHTYSGSAATPEIKEAIVANKGKILWFSYDYCTLGARNSNTGRHSTLGKRYGCHLSFRYYKTDGTLTNTLYPCANSLEIVGKGRTVMAYTLPTDIQSVDTFFVALQPFAGPASGNSETWYIRNLKIEIGDKATPWMPNLADPEYALMGFNSNIEYDTSGFNNNGNKGGDFEYSADTPRYLTSTIFNNNYIAPGQLHIKDELTYSWWAYVDNWGSSLSGSMVSSIEGGGMGHQKSLNFYCGTGTTSNNYG